eukprot:4801588-Prymnesium_polylepis.1
MGGETIKNRTSWYSFRRKKLKAETRAGTRVCVLRANRTWHAHTGRDTSTKVHRLEGIDLRRAE